MKTLESTTDEVLNLAAQHFKVPRAELNPTDDFFKKLGINSLQALDLLTRLEQHFHIELPDLRTAGRHRLQNSGRAHPVPALSAARQETAECSTSANFNRLVKLCAPRWSAGRTKCA